MEQITDLILKGFLGGFEKFLDGLDWGYLVTLFLCILLSNWVMPYRINQEKTAIGRFIQAAIVKHRWRIPLMSSVLAFVFVLSQDGLDYPRWSSQAFKIYFQSTIFGMVFNAWFLDWPATVLVKKYPKLARLLGKKYQQEEGQL